MQKALVLDEVISESWAGLAEQMADPIIQAENSIQNLKGVIDESLAEPAAVVADTISGLVEGIAENWESIKIPVIGVTLALGGYATVLGVVKGIELAHGAFIAWKNALEVVRTGQIKLNTAA